MRRRRKDQNGEYNYWQPATDMMTGLVFVLMLIVALLGLYQVTIQDINMMKQKA